MPCHQQNPLGDRSGCVSASDGNCSGPPKNIRQTGDFLVSFAALAVIVMQGMARQNPVNDSCTAPSPGR